MRQGQTKKQKGEKKEEENGGVMERGGCGDEWLPDNVVRIYINDNDNEQEDEVVVGVVALELKPEGPNQAISLDN